MSDQQKQRILVAEDNRVIADVIRFNIERAGYFVSAVHDGGSAKLLLDAEPYSLVIADCQMPVMSGIELCRWMRGSAGHVDTKFILCSAKGYEIETQLLDELRIHRLVCKPFSPRALVGLVAESIGTESVAV